jgi:HK97 family phage prohead protease
MRDRILVLAAYLVALARDLTGRRPALVRFADAGPVIRLDAPGARTFAVDASSRTVSGLILPWNTEARSGGRVWSFPEGSVQFGADASRVKLWVQHDPNRAVGFATALESKPDGLYGTFKVARGAAGDEALSMAEDRVWDGFSVGIAEGGTYDERDGVTYAVTAPLMETSLTPAPAFDDARVQAVAATAARNRGENMPENTPPAVADAPVDAPTMSAITDAIAAGFAGLAEAAGPEVVPAGSGFEVDEAIPYRFDGLESAADFSTDLIAYGRDHDGEAGNRVMRFMAEAFAPGARDPRFDVTTGNVATVNPARQRPDMFVDEREFRTPVYDALYSGALTDSTPFVVPKFTSDADVVDEHVEGVEPVAGSYVAGSQTVTPTALSGKVPITREVWDQGGNPQVSGLVWARMRYEFYRNLENAAAAVLTAAAGTIANIDLTAGATDDVLVDELEAALVDLQFVAGGDTLSTAMTHVDLYKALAAASDSTGRKLLPLYGVTNGSGQARPRFASLDVAGYEFAPAWSLGATTGGASAGNSWLFDKGSVHLWNSAPTRLEFQFRVAFVDLAVWGYKAAAVTDTAGVRQITYDKTA